MYLYVLLSARMVLSASRVLLRAHRGRSGIVVVAALAAMVVGSPSRWTLPLRRVAPSGRARPKVLVVEDEPALARALAINLRAHGWEAVTAADGRSALDAIATEAPDVVLLDLGLPDMDGTEVIGGLRGWTSVPIVVVSGREHSGDKVDALDLGADDYVTKPFAMNELMARLRAAVRRAAEGPPTEAEVVVGPLVVDRAHRKVRRNGVEVRLTPTEWAFLELLVRNLGRLVSREQILREVWGPAYLKETHYLRVYAAQLRRKLEDDPAHPRHLLTSAGMGYTLDL